MEVRLLIRNTTSEPLLFSTFDTFRIMLKDSKGHAVEAHGGRDETLRTKPVVIDAGAKYCLFGKAMLSWNDAKTRKFTYYDGTGMVLSFFPLASGEYTLQFRCKVSDKSSTQDGDGTIKRWTGNAVTNEVRFKIVD